MEQSPNMRIRANGLINAKFCPPGIRLKSRLTLPFLLRSGEARKYE